ncbi:MAG: hypothetical protein Q7S01_01875 [bacterium]|nr:hypothetical protein [bacterium]
MAESTIVNTPARDDGAAGWAVAVIVLIAVVILGILWFRLYGTPAPATPQTGDINVTIPTQLPDQNIVPGTDNVNPGTNPAAF